MDEIFTSFGNTSQLTWMLLVFVFIVMPIHVLIYKHKQRSFIAAWLIALVSYFALLTPVGFGLAYWQQLTAALELTPRQNNIASIIAGLIVVVAVNAVWIRFLRYLKSPPSTE
ncbi:MAG: hypothetical protein ACKVRO_13360 [Micropepsaceae bacterium]